MYILLRAKNARFMCPNPLLVNTQTKPMHICLSKKIGMRAEVLSRVKRRMTRTSHTIKYYKSQGYGQIVTNCVVNERLVESLNLIYMMMAMIHSYLDLIVTFSVEAQPA